MSLLRLNSISKVFGGVQALTDMSLEIREGEIYGLIGPNGAGKTTLFNVLTGVYTPTGGDITFDSESLIGQKPHQIAATGVARTFQNIRLFQSMTALENVMVGMHSKSLTGPMGAIFKTKSSLAEENNILGQCLIVCVWPIL